MRHDSNLHEYRKSNDPNHTTLVARTKMLFGTLMIRFLFFWGLGGGGVEAKRFPL